MMEIYKHFKHGTLYKVIARGTHTETEEALVVYREFGGPDTPIWIRPQAMWDEEVEWPDGVVRPRFVPVREGKITYGPISYVGKMPESDIFRFGISMGCHMSSPSECSICKKDEDDGSTTQS